MAKSGVVQVSWMPPGRVHRAPLHGSMRDAVEAVAGHFTRHSGKGGWVGVAPVGRGVAVQLHAANGAVEAWRILRPAIRDNRRMRNDAFARRIVMGGNVGSFNAKHPRNPKGSHLGGKFRRK